MKNLLLIFGFLLFLLPDAKSQGPLTTTDSTILTNQDTQITYLITRTKGKADLWAYSVHVVSDSLSGATAGSVYLQGTNDGSVWYTMQTLTLDGAAQQSQVWTGTLYAMRMRIYAITPSGSKTIRYRNKSILKRCTAP